MGNNKEWLDPTLSKEQRVFALTLYIGHKLSGTHSNLAAAILCNVTNDQLVAITNDFTRMAETDEMKNSQPVQEALQEFVDTLEQESRDRIAKVLAEI